MARPIYYEQRRKIQQPRYKVYQFYNGKWKAVFALDELEKLVTMYGNREGFRIKDQETKEIVYQA